MLRKQHLTAIQNEETLRKDLIESKSQLKIPSSSDIVSRGGRRRDPRRSHMSQVQTVRKRNTTYEGMNLGEGKYSGRSYGMSKRMTEMASNDDL